MEDPATIGPYTVIRRIGRGGTSVVYEARREGCDPVAVKVLRRELCRDASVRRRFEREARLLTQIRHPGILPVLDQGEDEDVHFLVLPLVEEPTLHTLLAEVGGPIAVPGPHAGLLKAVASVLLALDAIHQRGVIHRDITPGNVFVDPATCEGRLADFGVVKILGSESLLTQTGALLGTVPYMAPEQLGTEPITPACDVYQVGLLLHRMVCGRLPFDSRLTDAVRAKCLEPRLPGPTECGARIPQRLDDLIRRAVSKTPAERPGSAAEMAAVLDLSL